MRVLVLLLVASAAAAGPLPKGTKLVVEKNQLWFVEGDIKVPVFDGDARERPVDSITKIDVDGDTISVTMNDCVTSPDDPPRTISLAAMRARVENMRGMQLHLKKQYADAIAHFALAAKGDPATPLFATNLLSAQAMAAKLDDADRTLATYGATNVPWFAWRLAVDPELKALRGRPSTKPFGVDKPTKLVFKGNSIATSPLGYVAVDDALLVGMGPSTDHVAVYALKTNTKQLELELWMGCLDNPEAIEAVSGSKCTKQDRATQAAHQREVSALLGSLGFTIEPATWIEAKNIDDKTGALASPDKSVQLVFKDDKLTITRGKATKSITIDPGPYQIGFAKSVVVLQYRVPWACGGMDMRRFTSAVYALP